MEDEEYELKGITISKCSTEEDKSECAIKKQKGAKKEVKYDVPSYFNVLKCGRKLLDILDMSYERTFMDNAREE